MADNDKQHPVRGDPGARHKSRFKAALGKASDRLEILLEGGGETIRAAYVGTKLPSAVAKWFDEQGTLAREASPEVAVAALRELAEGKLPPIRISQEIEPWLENRRRANERLALRREYELKVQSGAWPQQETTVPLFPYQREGMLHLAFTERALLADEMGLGKTIQAIAACALLHRLGKARRVLVVTPASLKTEWEEQIRRFTHLDYQLVFGGKVRRLAAYRGAVAPAALPANGEGPAKPAVPFFTIVNYER